jgi:uroporphyrinogen-III synthase
MPEGPLEGMTIGVTAERRAAQQADLLEKRGARIVHGPALRVFSVDSDEVLRAATADVVRRPPDFLLASTGFGMRAWFDAAQSWGARDALLAALQHANVANRGSKAASATAAVGLAEWFRAPHERLGELVERVLAEPLERRRVVLQLHGLAEPDAMARLTSAGADVVGIDAYRLSLPDDTTPAEDLVRAACAGELAAVTFVTATAVHNLFAVAAKIGLDTQLRDALNGPVVAACVGPVCAEGAIEEGVIAPLAPSRARLVPMVQTLTDYLAEHRSA